MNVSMSIICIFRLRLLQPNKCTGNSFQWNTIAEWKWAKCKGLPFIFHFIHFFTGLIILLTEYKLKLSNYVISMMKIVGFIWNIMIICCSFCLFIVCLGYLCLYGFVHCGLEGLLFVSVYHCLEYWVLIITRICVIKCANRCKKCTLLLRILSLVFHKIWYL
jgi:hypothetical protein